MPGYAVRPDYGTAVDAGHLKSVVRGARSDPGHRCAVRMEGGVRACDDGLARDGIES